MAGGAPYPTIINGIRINTIVVPGVVAALTNKASTAIINKTPMIPTISGLRSALGATPRAKANIMPSNNAKSDRPVPSFGASAIFSSTSAACSSALNERPCTTPPASLIACCSATAWSHFS